MVLKTLLTTLVSVAVVGVIALQYKSLKEWLVYAVSEAESVLGSQTGKLKLRMVYDMAVERFPILSKVIPFSLFSKMVDDALIVMKEMIENNKSIADAIEGTIE